MPYPGPNLGRSDHTTLLEQARVACQQSVAGLPHVAAHLQPMIVLDEFHRMALRLRSTVLTQTLPPQTIIQEAKGFTDQHRYATWWDHFKATHRQRWWMRWRRWDVAYTTDRIPFEGRSSVTVRARWMMPRAPALPDALGPAVLYTEVGDRRWSGW